MSSARTRLGLTATIVALSSLFASAAHAAWEGGAHGSAASQARSLDAVQQPTASASNRSVTIGWSGASSGAPATGYLVKRYDGSGNAQSVGSGCSGTIAQTTCTETAVPPGTWRYRVTPANANWRGAESPASGPVTVAAPALSLNRSSVTSLPATVTGQITNFIGGQTVSLRLDGPGGQTLGGGITPSPVPGTGTANVSVTLPAGTAAGPHTIHAVGAAGDSAAAPLAVLVPQTLATSAWDLRDASAGTGEVNGSDPVAFASDGRTVTATAPPTAFSTSRYLQLDFNGPLPTTATPSSAGFDFRFAAGSATSTACFYFDLRRASTNAVLATHGSSASPVGCVTGTGQTTFATSLPAVSSTAIANDLRVRVYVRASGSVAPALDLATARVTVGPGSVTLYDEAFTDALSGGSTDRGWPLVASGGTAYRSASTWPTAFAAGRYLRLTPGLRSERRGGLGRLARPQLPPGHQRLGLLVPRGAPGHDRDRYPRQCRVADLVHLRRRLSDRHSLAPGDQHPGAGQRRRAQALRAQHRRPAQRPRPGRADDQLRELAKRPRRLGACEGS